MLARFSTEGFSQAGHFTYTTILAITYLATSQLGPVVHRSTAVVRFSTEGFSQAAHFTYTTILAITYLAVS